VDIMKCLGIEKFLPCALCARSTQGVAPSGPDRGDYVAPPELEKRGEDLICPLFVVSINKYKPTVERKPAICFHCETEPCSCTIGTV
jgi:hypothetical protein